MGCGCGTMKMEEPAPGSLKDGPSLLTIQDCRKSIAQDLKSIAAFALEEQAEQRIAPKHSPSGVSEPVWKCGNHNRQMALASLSVLEECTARLEATCPEGARWGIQEILNAVVPLLQWYQGAINTGIDCPCMSAEEDLTYSNLAEALFPRWSADTFEAGGGSSQIHALCDIFKYLDDIFGSNGRKVGAVVGKFRQVTFPCLMMVCMMKSDVASKACLVVGKKWGLVTTNAYQSALARLLRNAEGYMSCRYDDDNNCGITKATRAGHVVRVDFRYSGNKCGTADVHDPHSSVIGWDGDNGTESANPSGVHISFDTNTGIVGWIEFQVPNCVPDWELWFRFSGKCLYTSTYLDFDPANAKLLPKYWDKTTLLPQLATMGAGLNLRKSENVYKARMAPEHQSEITDEYVGYNMFCIKDLRPYELEDFQRLFDTSFRKKFTRDRKDGGVPERLCITRGQRCQNVQNWIEYSRTRWLIKEELAADKGLPRSIDGLKTAGAFLDEDQYRLDSGAHEAFLFHGTNDDAAVRITRGDFLVNLAGSNAGTLYGKGIYLAESVCKSDEYTKANVRGERCILVCRAALGYVNYNCEVAPSADKLVKSCTDGPYHCVVGDREKCRGTYREIIVYSNTQVYPEYVIWYKRAYSAESS